MYHGIRHEAHTAHEVFRPARINLQVALREICWVSTLVLLQNSRSVVS